MLQRRDHVNELLSNQARQQAKDVRKLAALEEEYKLDVEDHLESKIEELEERLAGHAHREGARAESKSFEETHERFEEVREMTPSGGYLSGLLWVVVLIRVEIDQSGIATPSSWRRVDSARTRRELLVSTQVLMHVAGGAAYCRAYAHLKKQTKVV